MQTERKDVLTVRKSLSNNNVPGGGGGAASHEIPTIYCVFVLLTEDGL